MGGHQFLLTEPDGFDCFNAVGIVMSMIGEPDKLMDNIRNAAENIEDAEERGWFVGFKMTFSADRFRRVPKSDLLDLLEMTTDKDRAWYGENRLSGEHLLELIAEVASILPFDGVLRQKGNIAGALVSAYIPSSDTSETSSGNGTGGDQTTSPDAESDGSYIKPASAPNEESAPN